MSVTLPQLDAALERVDRRLTDIVGDCDPLVHDYIREISSTRGKLIRPRLMIIQAEMLGEADLDTVANCAACCELLHTATLIHDDVIDSADTRRGNLTLNNRHGNELAVVVGDYLLALVLKAINAERDFTLTDMVLSTSQEMGLGVIEEINHRNDFKLDYDKYYEVIYLKTAALFRLCCAMGAYLGGANDDEIRQAGEYGKQLGLGFQIIDDLLDLLVESQSTGKPSFNDLLEGRITLPVIHALVGQPDETRLLIETFQNAPNSGNGLKIRQHLISLGSIKFSHHAALEFIDRARRVSSQLELMAAWPNHREELRRIEERITKALEPQLIQAAS